MDHWGTFGQIKVSCFTVDTNNLCPCSSKLLMNLILNIFVHYLLNLMWSFSAVIGYCCSIRYEVLVTFQVIATDHLCSKWKPFKLRLFFGFHNWSQQILMYHISVIWRWYIQNISRGSDQKLWHKQTLTSRACYMKLHFPSTYVRHIIKQTKTGLYLKWLVEKQAKYWFFYHIIKVFNYICPKN